MHVLFLMNRMREFDPGNDLLVNQVCFLTWRSAEQLTPNGWLYATVHGGANHWDLRPLGGSHEVFPGIDNWLNRQLRGASQLGDYHRTDFDRVLKPVDSYSGLDERRSLMNRFMTETFGISNWWLAGETPLGSAGISENARSMRRKFVDDLLRLQAV